VNKWLFWALLGLVAWLLFQSWSKKNQLARRQAEQASAQKQREAKANPPALDQIVTCAHCGLHLPQTEASGQGSDWFCSTEHLALGRRGPAK
jgi:uncharacterized protein